MLLEEFPPPFLFSDLFRLFCLSFIYEWDAEAFYLLLLGRVVVGVSDTIVKGLVAERLGAAECGYYY